MWTGLSAFKLGNLQQIYRLKLNICDNADRKKVVYLS